LMNANHVAVRNELVDRLTKSWGFTETQLADLSIFHLVNILMLLAGSYGYLGQFEPTIWALCKTLGDDEVYEKPSELRAKANGLAEPVAEPDEESVATEKKATVN
jgi:hypothetical protein